MSVDNSKNDLSARLTSLETALTELKETQQRNSLACKQLKKRQKLDANKTAKKKPPKYNAYMFWCNIFDGGRRKKIVEQLKRESPDTSVPMKEIAHKLGEQWRGLPDDAKANLKILAAEHNEKLAAEFEISE